jgi:hypothetical protein
MYNSLQDLDFASDLKNSPLLVKLVINLLKVQEGQKVPVGRFLKEYGLHPTLVMQKLEWLVEKGLATMIGDTIVVERGQKFLLAIKAIEGGIDAEKICRAAGWREFEDIGALFLVGEDYKAEKHFRFNLDTKRYEIDILGLKKPWMLVVECKRWRSCKSITRVADVLVSKTLALLSLIPKLKTRIGLDDWDEVIILPVILTLLKNPLKIECNVPVVPIGQFRSFLSDFQSYTDDLKIFKLKFR